MFANTSGRSLRWGCVVSGLAWLAAASSCNSIELSCEGHKLLLNGGKFSVATCNEAAGQSCHTTGNVVTCNKPDQHFASTGRYRTDDSSPLGYECSGTCG